MRRHVIAIDGPAGSGKSTVAQCLARHIGYSYIDTGAMYRGLTWLALKSRVDPDSEKELARMARETDFTFEYNRRRQQPWRVLINGRDLTAEVRSKRVTAHVSMISAIPGVRHELVKKQRELAENQDVVMEGRDIGTIVFPDADAKFFITASVEERARRRCLDFRRDGYDVGEERVMRELVKRDLFDSNRAVSPLSVAGEAVVVDTTGKTIEEVTRELLKHAGFADEPGS
jgi:CMP/dCMP kinase